MHVLKITLLLVLTKPIGCDTTQDQDTRQSLRLTKAEATEMCSRNGGRLASYNEIKSDTVKMELESGGSIWLSDHVKFAPFISLEGCYSADEFGHTIRLPEVKSVRDCIDGCFNKGGYGQYIGMKRNLCYCLTRLEIEGPKIKRVNDTLCTITCDYNALDVCGGNVYISIYKIFDENKQHLPINTDSKGFCVCIYVYGNHISMYSTSCYGHHRTNAGGYFCVDGFKFGALECSPNKNAYCLMDDAGSRVKAEENCLKKNGQLADHEHAFGFVIAEGNFQSNRSYWTRTYRTFALSRKEGADNSVCLAAVKTQKFQYVSQEHKWREVNILAIEPNNCAQKKRYFCSPEENSYDQFTSSMSSAMEVDKNDTTLSVGEYSTNAKYQQYEATVLRNNQSVLSTISLCVSIITFILLLVVLYTLYRLRKRIGVPPQVAFSNGLTHQSGSFAPGIVTSHTGELYYDTEINGTLGHERSDIRVGSGANETIPDYVNDPSDNRGNNHVYEGLANERAQPTYETLSM